uniref:NADH dehydrogenase subunit 2 n=1 Tax=Buniapone amblyops TaxID=613574 RepID=UPI002A7FF279|nr:NADH dehydrogenase subunit 2 [Buniapone amblyops]WON66608.1 NADH dehydrogenase subunit 2 [Buniapone amblyops]
MFNFFFLILFISILNILSLSLSDMLIIWFFMEMSNFLFISYIIMMLKNKKMVFFYFLIQFMSSSLIILSISLNLFYSFYFSNWMAFFTLMLKLNFPPLHLWMLMIIDYLDWISTMLALTVQKIIPYYLLSFFIPLINPILFWSIVCITLIFPPLMLLNILNFKKILFFSSMNQSGWFLTLIYLDNLIWLIYFSLYSLISSIIIFLINYSKLSFNFKYFYTSYMLFMYLFMFFNIASIPPFMFMMFKWLNIFIFMFNMKFNLILFMFMFNSLFMLYIYIRMTFTFLFHKYFTLKFIYYSEPSFSFIFICLSMMTIFSSMFFFLM